MSEPLVMMGGPKSTPLTTAEFRAKMEEVGKAFGIPLRDVLTYTDEIGQLSLKRLQVGGKNLQEQYLGFMFATAVKQWALQYHTTKEHDSE
jgi:hypothetical protein